MSYKFDPGSKIECEYQFLSKLTFQLLPSYLTNKQSIIEYCFSKATY